MKTLTITLVLLFSTSAFAEHIDDWLKTDEAQKEAFFVSHGTLLCSDIRDMRNLYNYLVVNNYQYNPAEIKRSPCYAVNAHRYGRLVGTDGEFLLIEYRRYDSKVILNHWTHRSLIAKWASYKNRLYR